jgi:hypothetical protein
MGEAGNFHRADWPQDLVGRLLDLGWRLLDHMLEPGALPFTNGAVGTRIGCAIPRTFNSGNFHCECTLPLLNSGGAQSRLRLGNGFWGPWGAIRLTSPTRLSGLRGVPYSGTIPGKKILQSVE